MRPIEDLLKHLSRPEVLEFGLVTNRLPSVNIGGRFEPVDDEAPTTERLVAMLVTVGGGRHVDSLSDKPVQWTTRLAGIGVVAVAAIMRKDIVQARFTVAKRDVSISNAPLAAQPAARTSANPPAAHPSVQPKPFGVTRTLESNRSVPVTASSPAPPPVKPAMSTMTATPHPMQVESVAPARPSAPVPVARPQPTAPPALPPAAQVSVGLSFEDEWEDDDEPTLQTLSPPLGRPDPALERAAQEKLAQEKLAQEKLAQEKLAQEKLAQERAAQERLAQEKLAQERAAQERLVQERAAQERAVQEKLAQEKLARERAAVEQRTAEERAARERTATERASSINMRVAPRRSSTPTSVIAVDVDPATHQTSPDIELEAVSATSSAAVDLAPPIDEFLALAVGAAASDLHIVAGRPILLRVASDLLPRTQPIRAEHVNRIIDDVVPTRLREQLTNEGACRFALEHPVHGRFRVTVARHQGGFTLNLRVVPREIPTLASLGLPESIALALRNERGLILVTSPASHGKSSTVAALVDAINRGTARHVLTLEEPVEHVHPRKRGWVSQRDVGLHARGKARALRAALRDDADVIVVGEMRDVESVRLALAASESCLVIGTLSTSSVAKAVDRLLDLFPASEEPLSRAILASSLRLIVGQRLVPSVDRTRLHVAVELLPWSVALQNFVRERRTHQIPSLQQRGQALGIVRLDESLAQLARAQKVSIDVAKQYAESPADVENAADAARARRA